jgi:hypothetical protein
VVLALEEEAAVVVLLLLFLKEGGTSSSAGLVGVLEATHTSHEAYSVVLPSSLWNN